MSAAAGRYDVAEFPGGWRVIETNANGDKIHKRQYRTRADALARAAQLTDTYVRISAAATVRKRAKNRCECLGECDRGHHARCALRDGERDRVPGGSDVVLNVVALNHNNEDLREENLRVYCQLCRLYHDADAAGTDPLFTVGKEAT